MSGRGQKQKQVKKKAKTASAREREKYVEDKTFGMKNKKGKKAQAVATQYRNQGVSKAAENRRRQLEAEKQARKAAKEREAKDRLLMGRVVQQPQHCPNGVDPKTILCMYYKRGHCENGSRCKFSHDRRVEQKKKKKNIFEEEPVGDNMDAWDEATLKKAVDAVSKTSKANATAKICNHFLKSLEDRKFGWNWVCPRGVSCIYRHVLPKGYVLKKAKAEVVEERPLHEILEEERAKLVVGEGTMVTPDSFKIWKAKIKAEAAKKASEKTKTRQKAVARGAKLTGKELLQNADADMFAHEGPADDDLMNLRKQRRQEEEEADKENAEIAAEMNAAMADVEAKMEDPNKVKKDAKKVEEKKEEDKKIEDKKEEEKTAEAKLQVDASLFAAGDEDLDDLDFSDEDE
eukprot:TRINITY_DN10837_c0_g1_i1.p1 TRINITY_DN10837_c0_g1~~TRINITY_DN10837_c0_g1_i1.p1  ORF type:complete len:403 (+),score=159.71 TRINITY_DN10837_c0_g1_i1:71-1279(+)